MKRYLILSFVLISVSVSAQNRLWERTYNYHNTTDFWKIQKDGSNYYVLGGRDSISPLDAVFYKLNQNFDTVWSIRNIDVADNSGDWVRIDSTRILLGTSKDNLSTNAYDMALRVVSNSGTIMNTVVTSEGVNNNEIYSILKTEDKGFIILGTSGYDTPPYTFYALYKIDSLYNVQWITKYGLPGNDTPVDLIRCKDGSYLILGESEMHNYSFHPVVVKVKADGILIKLDSILVKGYPLNEDVHYRGNIIECIDDGYAFVGGYDPDGSNTKYYGFTVKLDAFLNVEWKVIDSSNGASYDTNKKIVQLKDSSYIVIGNTQSKGLIYRISKDGNLIKSKTFTSAICGNASFGNFLNIDILPDSTFLVCGTGTNAGNTMGYLAKFDSLWSVPYDATLHYCDTPPIADYSCEQDTNSLSLRYTNTANSGAPYGIIEVCQWKFEDSTTSNQLIPTYTLSSLTDSVWARLIVTNNLGCKDTIAKKVKIIPTKFLTPIQPQENSKFQLYVYPNPASGFVNFKITGENKKYKLVVNNFLGQQVGNYLLNAKEFKLSLTDYSAGMYFYKLSDEEGNSENGKFVVE
jgi:hypothetical protein